MDLRQLAYVVAIAEHGGFTRAAEAVHVAQPSLSQSVRRSSASSAPSCSIAAAGTVALTAAGEALLGPARQALRDAEVARAAVIAVVDVEAGHLDIACLPTLAVAPAAEMIGRFRRLHPRVTVRLAEPEEVGDVTDHVADGRSELGFAELPSRHRAMVTHELEGHDYVVVVPAGPDVATPDDEPLGNTVTLDQLADRPLVTTLPGTSTRRILDDAFARRGWPRPSQSRPTTARSSPRWCGPAPATRSCPDRWPSGSPCATPAWSSSARASCGASAWSTATARCHRRPGPSSTWSPR